MATLHTDPPQVTIRVVVPFPEEVLLVYTRIKVHRSTTGINGTYTEVTDPGTRLSIVPDQTIYEYTDPTGSATDYYRVTYFNPETSAESSVSDSQLGGGDPALDIVSVQDVKDNYLLGADVTDDTGTPFPDTFFEYYIKSAVSWIERKLDIAIRKTTILDERHDLYVRDYEEYIITKLLRRPVISVEKFKMTLPNQVDVHDFDLSWVHLDKEGGMVELVPGPGNASIIRLGQSSQWLPIIAGQVDYLPQVFRVDYTAGFEKGEVPFDLAEVIAKVASFGPLNIMGDLIAGAGIASKTISLDGLSTSVNTTSSATNCLHPATKIMLADGSTPTIESLVGRLRFNVACVDMDGKPCIGVGHSARRTVEDDVLSVQLSNGEKVLCNASHPFRAPDGHYIPAGLLDPGQELTPCGLATDIQNIKVINVDGTKEKLWLYDITVDEHSCFGIGQGVIVHNSGYGARLIQYNKEIKDQLPTLRRYFHGNPLGAVV